MNMWISPAVASSVHVCMDKGRDGGWAGRIYIRISEEAFSFHDMYEMLSFLECFYDYIEFPKMSTISRTFKDSPPGVRSGKAFELFNSMEKENGKYKVKLSEEDMEKKQGEQGTFIVRIQYRQNATWQGHVTWAEKNKTVPFRSALELMKLIDSTQDEQNGEWK